MGLLKVPVTQHDHAMGPASAPMTMVEYGDYECPACGAAYPVVGAVLKYFGPRLRFVFRHFPLTQVHPNAETAAESAEFAASRGRFWDMHDAIYQNQERLSLPLLLTLADALQLSEVELRDALATEKFAAKVRNDFLGGVRSGVNGTPTFFINGKQHEGTYDFDDLVASIEQYLPARARL